MNKSVPNDYPTLAMKVSNSKHGGNVYENAKKLNLLPSEIIDASASLVPFDPPQILIESLNAEIKYETLSGTELRNRLDNGLKIPKWFSYTEVTSELIKSRPPNFLIFSSSLDVPKNYKRFLLNNIREQFNLKNIPIRLKFKVGNNPYV